uniref:Leucine-rich repeat-containing N-terminal plant-type domain-containing protein n=1 Tax=Oryza punctata TaxID=4537 RepID=A0A0E0JVR1_ORYPU
MSILCLVLVLMLSSASSTSCCAEHESNCLLQFLAGLSQDGGLAASWRHGRDCCSWEGITCSSTAGKVPTVTDVMLASKKLEGSISPALGRLSSLLHLNLSHNSLSGGLPSEVMSSGSIVILDISFNSLGGILPLSPPLTTGLKLLLQVLDISSNKFSMELPSLDAMAHLVVLNASNNSFSGHIPTNFWSNSPSLAVLELSYNQFSGSIPPELGNCSGLRLLKAGHNNLCGTLPDELFNATSLECLSFPNNNLQGTLEGENVIKLGKLATLDLGENNLSGNIPDGEIPETIYSCSNLTALRLSCNKFQGQLSKGLGNLKSLSFLSLTYNSLTNITNALQILRSSSSLTTLLIGHNFMKYQMMITLMVLSLSGCSLSGKIPRWLSKLSSLEMLVLDRNQLTGPIPDWIGSLNFLFYLDVSNNNLTGEIPTAFVQMPMLRSDRPAVQVQWYPRAFEVPIYISASLQYRMTSAFPKVLDLGNNEFTGLIPPDIGQLKGLHKLNLSSNKLYGDIPQSICNLTNLLMLDLSSNKLSGTIPGALKNLNFLTRFNISYNDLEGPIPTEGQLSTFTDSSFIGNPKLCGPMLSHRCSSAKAVPAPAYTLSTDEFRHKVIFGITVGLFFALGVLLDQMVFSRMNIPDDGHYSNSSKSFVNSPLLELFPCSRSSNKLPMDLLGFVVVLLLCLASSTRSCTDQEKSLLLQFLAGLSEDGGLAVSWRNDTDCCTWEGGTCSMDATISEVLLASKGLEGNISQSLGSLTGLLRLNLSHNSLSGELPLVELMSSSSIVILDVSFNHLSRALQEFSAHTTIQPLQVMNLSSNLFTGQFPSTAWKVMNNLVALNASNNSFTGRLPSSLCINSPSFAELDLSFNQFGGSIPKDISNCSMLRVLKGGHNNFHGALPDEIFNASSLEYLSFPDNVLSGVLDDANIIKLSKLSILDLEQNMFSGKIPKSIGQLKRLEELHLGENKLYGELPSTLGNCTNLKILDLKFNNLSGDLGKVDFSSLSNLTKIDLLVNNFSGTVPESISACINLIVLRLARNNFHGEFSQTMNRLRSLVFLSVADNAFTNIRNALHIFKTFRNLKMLLIGGNFKNEVLPEDETIDGFENLQYLSISGSSLYGKMPVWLSKLTNLEKLHLYDNQLTGSIPVWIKNLNFLFHLDITNNNFTGEILTTLIQLPMLKSKKMVSILNERVSKIIICTGSRHQLLMEPATLNIGRNGFTGVIPPEIGQLKALDMLDLSYNSFSGEIPQAICNLADLEMLDLSNNNLTGTIPLELSKIHFLSVFNVSNNDLEGPIPTGGQFDTFDNSSFDGNPKLCGPMIGRHCNSAKAIHVSTFFTDDFSINIIFGITVGLFFALGVLLDQMRQPYATSTTN